VHVHSVLSLLWPARCAGCNTFVGEGTAFCRRCDVSVVPLGRVCSGCAMPWEGEGLCRGCRSRHLPFERASAVLAYGGSLVQALLRFKHGGHRHLARALGSYLAPTMILAKDAGVDLACPVPLHPHRLRKRGFNQGMELLRSALLKAARNRRVDTACDVMVRTIDTPPLGRGSPEERSRAVAGAFAVKRPGQVAGKRILIVDDVMTTGATLAECARTLASAGAASVWVLALARAL
jgi:ComF family protein